MLYFIYTYTRLHHGPDFPLAQMWAWSNVTPGINGRVRGQAQAQTSFHPTAVSDSLQTGYQGQTPQDVQWQPTPLNPANRSQREKELHN